MNQALFSRFAVLVLALFLSACQRNKVVESAVQPAVSVRVETIEPESRVATEDVIGTVHPRLQSVIAAKVSGQIDKMLVVPGQQVKAGDTLVQLSARELQAKLEEALATEKQTQRDLDRYTTLLSQKVVSRQDFDTAEAKARIARAAVVEAETNVTYATIRAPFDGQVTQKLADVGDLAEPGKPLLQIEDSTSLRLDADVPAAIIGNVRMGGHYPVRIDAVGTELDGVVSEISPAGDPNSRTFLVKLNLPLSPGLLSGLFGRVSIPVGSTQVLLAPVTAVIERGEMELLFIAANGQAQLRIVKTGKRVGDQVELVSGVEAGEQVIVEGQANLTDGQPVDINHETRG